jgi:hypothetical protein
VLLDRPVVNVLLVSGYEERPEMALVQVDHVSGQTTRRALSPELVVPHNGSSVALTDVLRTDVDRPRLAELRQSLGAALNLDQLECIMLPTGALPRSWSTLDRVKRTIDTLRELRRGTMRSTMSPWGTLRVLSRLHRVAVPEEHDI